MTADPTTRPLTDPEHDAARARSVLACPAAVTLAIEGRSGSVGDSTVAGLGVDDRHGTPTFHCPAGSALAGAAARGARATITVSSGLGAPGSAERATRLLVSGRLAVRASGSCGCCAESRETVVLAPEAVLLAHAGGPAVDVALASFRSPDHELNAGYLQRVARHLAEDHQAELRRTVAAATATPLEEVLGVGLSELTREGVAVGWVDRQGAHLSTLRFPRPARGSAELHAMLRHELDAGPC
ncbi:hypothetical protein [Nocardioides sp. zg-DK7169]|uniref:hypothetical protein n=1 Tax=Nocardioides sp. zg-DK7169 TaxID=2736600 RepID=UPI0015527300|nr:hypothetical protein [Nocardioides sp. zg-DK7169]NPC98363.1 hypothetical protein [Nocardioides sp. zg-DK7169]